MPPTDILVPMGWATTEGTIIERELTPINYTAGGERIVYYEPQVRYEYTVDGVRYECSRTAQQALRFQNRRMAESLLNIYDTGQTVTVIYNPLAPREAYLAESAALTHVTRDFVLGVLGVVAVIVLIVVGVLLVL